MKKIINIVGARPNFMKIAPIHREMLKSGTIEPILVHTGQHYDEKMSKTFFVELGMPEPDVYLGVGSGSHANQTAAVMTEIETLLIREKPDWLVVVGDVNSTIAASLAASKLHIPIAHVEAGLRSFDRNMPEEINRILTDSISDLMFVTEQSGLDNLEKEGVNPAKVKFVGNVMIDSLVDHLEKAQTQSTLVDNGLREKDFVLMTLHRPSNVDNEENMNLIIDILEIIEKELPVLFPIHPRTLKMLGNLNLESRIKSMKNLKLTEPLGYLSFLKLMNSAKFVLTDSGGIQEETTFLKTPCLTLRENTERPITADIGTNRLVGLDRNAILKGFRDAMDCKFVESQIPPLWDGKAAQRIVKILAE
jgi:UDP-N-acetylglucosamine 2-epimerase (non-hydrolysing)